MKTLDDIRQDENLKSQIRWDMKPRERIRRKETETEEDMAQIQKMLQDRVGYYFYIEVRYQQPALYLYENYPDGSGRYIAEVTEIPEQLIHGAIQEAGGKIDADGRYPVNTQIITWLKKRLAK
ncbi:MAG TPA: hypothetical protein VHT73_07105 [Thermodesulfobacteriota bacterium]|nr:hypothetical protein [Thermodesulfobacteriota bacterium]